MRAKRTDGAAPAGGAGDATRQVLEDLNEGQRRAVTWGEGPLLIVAGAGTGKTSVITRRIAYLIVTKRAEPSQILAMTFTEKAAAEMEERVDLLVPYGYTDVWISTFHAFGDRILREHALEMGLVPDFRVLSKAEQIIFVREHLFDFPLDRFRPLGDPTRHIAALATLISRAKDEDVSPDDYLVYAEKLAEQVRGEPGNAELAEEAARQMELAQCYQTYEELKLREGKLDFGDQVNLTLKLLREHPAVLERVRDQFRYILVDEFQDTNYAQFELVKLLAGGHRNLTVVADDDQAVYKFRGAAISNVLGFTDTYPGCEPVVLTENYRSTQVVLDAARRLILYNNPDRLEVRNRIDKRLHGQVESGPAVRHLHFDTISSQADTVAKIIEEKVAAGDARYRDFAVLVRSNNDADPFLRSMNMREIPHQFSGSRGLYRRREVRDLIAFLHVVADPDDSLSLHHFAGMETYGLDPLDLTLMNRIARRRNRTLFRVMRRLGESGEAREMKPESGETIATLLADIEHYVRLSMSTPTGELLYQYIVASGTLARLMQAEGLSEEQRRRNDERLRNIAKFFHQVRSVSEVLREDRVGEFVRVLDLLRDAGEDPAVAEAPPDVDAVNVLTVHKAKGLEFTNVFIVSLVAQKFPWPRRRDPIALPDGLVREVIPAGDTHLQEERRLFYVGMTRARRELILTSARDYGGRRSRKVSQFVLEALDLPRADIEAITVLAAESIGQFAPEAESRDGWVAPIPEEEMVSITPYQVDDYLTCPLKYKYIHLLRVPILQHHTVVYGNALHRAVAELEKRLMESRGMTDEELIAVFEAAWVSEGFLTREHEERRLAAGREALRAFHRRQEETGSVPTYVEKEFSFLWDNNRVNGRWDRVDERDGDVVIIDFKSSDIRTEEEAAKRARESLQLTIYALAYREKFGQLPARVELHFLESGLVGAAAKSEKDVEKAGEKIREAARGIRSRDYAAKPSYMSCRYCAYQQICPSTAIREG